MSARVCTAAAGRDACPTHAPAPLVVGSARIERTAPGWSRPPCLPRWTALALAFVLAATSAHAASDARLSQAEALAKKRELDAAADLYSALVKEGVDGPGIRYNLGTLELERGHVGEAVLHLRAAARAAPLDDDVRHNLAVALEARTDRLAGEAPPDPVKALGARLPPRIARAALAIPLALLGLALAAVGLLVDDRRRALARTAALAWSALAVIGGALYACRLSVERTREAVVTADACPALKEPDEAAGVTFTAHAGLFGDIVDESGLFVRMRFENGLEAWIKADTVASVTSGPL